MSNVYNMYILKATLLIWLLIVQSYLNRQTNMKIQTYTQTHPHKHTQKFKEGKHTKILILKQKNVVRCQLFLFDYFTDSQTEFLCMFTGELISSQPDNRLLLPLIKPYQASAFY